MTGMNVAGSLPAWLTLLGLVGAAWVFARGGGHTAIHTLQAANQVLEKQNGVLEKRIAALEDQGKRDAELIAELRASRDVGEVVKPVVLALTQHEKRAEERHRGSLAVLDLIASRLGPDANGH